VWKLSLLIAVAALCASAAGARQPPAIALPAVSFTCPMDPDVIEEHAGTCPRCRMTLVPVRLDTAYSCPLHPSIIETNAGACRICRRPLAAVTVSLSWTCAGHPDVHELSPGPCADGRARIAVRERRAHGDHNPRHGGQFFMASDNWHHLEGTYPRAGVFRLFVYDDFTRPMPLHGISARIISTADGSAPSDNRAHETPIALTPAPNGRYLEAHVPVILPAAIAASVRFGPNEAEHRFDFSFQAFTKDPAAGAAAPQANTTRVESALPVEATRTITSLIAALRASDRQLHALLQQGALAELYLPALSAKDAALALDAHASALPSDRRTAATAALKRLVLAAWSIDRYGDLGDRPRLDAACRLFSDAVGELGTLYDLVR
jgi:hypothetical protein